MSVDLVTRAVAEVTPSTSVVLLTRAKARVATGLNGFCDVGESDFWFPVAPGTETLPPPPAATTNENPAPPNAIAVPPDFDDGDLCYLFQDLLPVGQGPVYAVELEPEYVLPPYTEEIPLLAITVSALSVREYPYEVTLPSAEVVLVTKAKALYVTLLDAAAGSLSVSGQAAVLKQARKLIAARGTFIATGYSSGFILNQLIGANAGTFTATGQNSGLVYQRLPMALEAGAFTLAGQDVAWFKGKSMPASAGSFTLSGEAAGKIRTYILTGNAGSFTSTGQAATLGDPSFNSVTLLLPMNGTNGSSTFSDAGVNSVTITRNGNAQISTAQSKFGGASGLFDGTGDYITATPSTALTLTGDFTIECWVRMASYKDMIVASSTHSTQGQIQLFRLNNGGAVSDQGRLDMYLDNNEANMGYLIRAGAGTLSINTWHHLAFTRSGSSGRLFVDGVQVGSTATSWTTGFRCDVVGCLFNSSVRITIHDYDGYVDEFRITKGVARYTANFSVPTGPFSSG